MAFGRRSPTLVKDPLPRTVESAEERGVVLPETYHVAALRERRLLIALRAVSIGLMGAIFLNLALVMTLYALLPLKEVRPFLVRVMDESTVVADVRPIEDTIDARELLTEKLVREFVTVRHELLRSDDVMRARWGADGQLAMMTTEAEYRRFTTAIADVLEDVRRLDAETLVTILSVVPITVNQSYVVDFRLTTYDRENRISSDLIYTATLEIEYRDLTDMTREQLLINPTGFTVTSYTLAEKVQ
jgi:type IV secretory pathway component VirB8